MVSNIRKKSFIHEARDAQKFINYVGSEVAAEIKNRRREQWGLGRQITSLAMSRCGVILKRKLVF